MKKRGKRAEGFLGMSFSMIFSIILIVFFIVAAFIAIRAFLDFKKCTQLGMFVRDFQSEIEKTWNSPGGGFLFESNLPSSIEFVCFANLSENSRGGEENEQIYRKIEVYSGEDSNLFFYPTEKACDNPDNKIKHLNIKEITRAENPYCIAVKGGKISIQIEKELNEESGLVRIYKK
jgi:hypothetical protein